MTTALHSSAAALRCARLILLAALTATLLGGCGAIVAQNPPGNWRPVNAVADGDERRVLLNGADVVSYFVDGKHQQGQPQFSSRYEEVTFRFASAEHKALFDRDPAKYLPQYGGYCANGIAYGIPWGGDAERWKMIDGRLYIFGGQASQEAFELDEKTNLALAEKYWAEEVKGSNSFMQRSRRLIFRVPHYQSGEDLARAVAQKKAATDAGR
jgi:YHS domain-containing protein